MAAAASGLIILVVLTAIFYSKSLDFAKGVDDCKLKGGQCVPENECGFINLDICPEKGEVCCLSVCKSRGGSCKQYCASNEEIDYLAECKNDEVCCTTK